MREKTWEMPAVSAADLSGPAKEQRKRSTGLSLQQFESSFPILVLDFLCLKSQTIENLCIYKLEKNDLFSY